ncbi:MAG: UvrD-helicase domain-containing protein [Christensenellaceae bacterium]|jgi:DNA helicase-2/ATP-dependent DNA helicase PcrA|nr:UvrD-helicase domain-containing protein [Christensenellaceae bacterium]
MLDYSSLNKAQVEAMTDTEGAVLVFAGAGSGKTRVLTYRAAYLVLNKGVNDYQVLAVTFTNKATNEMRERLKRLLGEDNRVAVSTFHALCAKILMKDANLLGYKRPFSIYDESDSLREIRKAVEDCRIQDAGDLIKTAKSAIDEAKNRGISADCFLDNYGDENSERIQKVYAQYEHRLHRANAMDFNDLLLKTRELFLQCPEVREYYAKLYRYVMVDEFQDTNGVQFELTKMLCSYHGNVFAVGDDDQSIYGWRGADITNILGFEKAFPNAKIHKLLQNYRSTKNIIDCANRVIVNNDNRRDKQLFTDNKQGECVTYYEAQNDFGETDFVIGKIKELVNREQYAPGDIAILVRRSADTNIFERKLSGNGMSYEVLGAFKFFEREEIKKVLSYLKLFSNFDDNQAANAIINFPIRGIGQTTIDKIQTIADENETSFMNVVLYIEQYSEAFRGGKIQQIIEFRQTIADITTRLEDSLPAFVEWVIERSELKKYYAEQAKTALAYDVREKAVERVQNLEEFIRYAKDSYSDNPNLTLADFLENIMLSVTKDDEPTQSLGKVKLATVHSVKGLEFRAVFIVCFEDGIFPSSRSVEDGSLEEERRIAYVAITRAKEKLFISYAQSRMMYNRFSEQTPSQFVWESQGKKTGEALSAQGSYMTTRQHTDNYRGGYGNGSYGSRNGGYYKDTGYRSGAVSGGYQKPSYGAGPSITEHMKSLKPTTPDRSATGAPKIYNTDMTAFQSGTKVRHTAFGVGYIQSIKGKADDPVATVVFENAGVKILKVKLAPIYVDKD